TNMFFRLDKAQETMTFKDVAMDFTQEEWRQQEIAPRKLYQDVMVGNFKNYYHIGKHMACMPKRGPPFPLSLIPKDIFHMTQPSEQQPQWECFLPPLFRERGKMPQTRLLTLQTILKYFDKVCNVLTALNMESGDSVLCSYDKIQSSDKINVNN
uniref:KRAB domain-containing protein n=1 Tax=Monodelphis domestica TaxID=13616 RepID=A0A5F8H0J5_MONDO